MLVMDLVHASLCSKLYLYIRLSTPSCPYKTQYGQGRKHKACLHGHLRNLEGPSTQLWEL